MPDSRSYITHYVKYFNLKAPSVLAQVLILLLLGAISGSLSSLVLHQQSLDGNYVQAIVLGINTGIIVVSLPALLTVAIIKTVKRKMMLKHAMLSTLLVTAVYSVLLLVNSFVFSITNNAAISYLILLLSNAFIYGYWFLMERVVIGRRKSAALVATVQPILNVLFYIPLGGYMLNINVTLLGTLIKLSAGMLVFLVFCYVFLYILDRPAKRMLKSSGIGIVESMLGQWLFNLTNDVRVIGYGAGIKRKLDADVLVLKGEKNCKGIFINPDLHFGPFQGVGGSIAPLQLGDLITKRYKTSAFVLHSPSDMQDNPIITAQVYSVVRKMDETIKTMMAGKFERAYGGVCFGTEGRCRAINLAIGDTSLMLLSKAPYVTEDMSREVGRYLRQIALSAGAENAILVDAHNTRFESASSEELKGIQKGSIYVKCYEKAIMKAMKVGNRRSLSFGASSERLYQLLERPKDIGEGYTSVCIFGFGKKKFCVVYFDANNMLPVFRNTLLKHIKSKFGMNAELCTSDTHSINTIASSASTSLGRYTDANRVIPALDSMIEEALKSMEPVKYAYRKVSIEDFPIWGKHADELIASTSKEVKRLIEFAAPVLMVITLLAAAWVISVV
jgi:putative membrane protein